MIKLKKKQITMIMLAVMVCIAGYLNIIYDKETYSDLDDYIATVTEVKDKQDDINLGEAQMVSSNGVENENIQDVFAKCRLERDESRSENIDMLTATINNSNVSDDAKLQAEGKLLNISDSIEKEINIENIIRLRGFDDVIAFISDENVTITVRTEKLTQPQVAQINDAVNEYIDTKNVKIVEVK